MATAPPPYENLEKQGYPPYQGSQAPYPANYGGQGQYPTGYGGQAPYPPSSYPPSQQYPQPVYPPNPQPGGGYQYQIDQQPIGDHETSFTTFSDKTIRRAFIRKVYLIMTAQLLVTGAFISIFQFSYNARMWVRRNAWFYYLSYATFLVTYIALVCCPSVRRKYPGNFIALSIFTLAFSYMTGTIASFYDTPAVLAAVGITAGVCIGITIFAIQTKVDFTLCSGLILVCSLVLFFTGLVCMIIFLTVGYNMVLHGVYAGVAILVFSIYLVYDTQLIVGGRRYELSPEDYIEGALQLYLDVVNMFLIILSLFRSN